LQQAQGIGLGLGFTVVVLNINLLQEQRQQRQCQSNHEGQAHAVLFAQQSDEKAAQHGSQRHGYAAHNGMKRDPHGAFFIRQNR